MTQGRADGTEWVTLYMVSFSLDAYHWIYVNDYYGNRRVRIFRNATSNFPVKTYLNAIYSSVIILCFESHEMQPRNGGTIK